MLKRFCLDQYVTIECVVGRGIRTWPRGYVPPVWPECAPGHESSAQYSSAKHASAVLRHFRLVFA